MVRQKDEDGWKKKRAWMTSDQHFLSTAMLASHVYSREALVENLVFPKAWED